ETRGDHRGPLRGHAADQLHPARRRRCVVVGRDPDRGRRSRGGRDGRRDGPAARHRQGTVTTVVRVSEWPFGSLATATTVYVCFLEGVNAGVNDTDWSPASGAVGVARATTVDPS